MKAVLLAGGEGTRLRPLTLDVPKPLVPIAHLPYLEQLISRLRRHGIRELILTACYLSEQIRDFCAESREGMKLTYVVEEIPLGTGGAVGNVGAQLDASFYVLNGDVLSAFDMSSLLDFHRSKNALATLALVSVQDPSRYGVADLTGDGRIARFVEKPKRGEAPSNCINAGIYVLEPEVLKLIPPREKVSIETRIFPEIASRGKLYGQVQDAYWIDVGTPMDYLQAHCDFLAGKIDLMTAEPRAGENWVSSRAEIARGAQLRAPVLIGRGCRLEEGSVVGPYAVLGRNCHLAPGSRIERSVLWDNVRLEKRTRVFKSIVGSGVLVEAGAILENEVIRSAV